MLRQSRLVSVGFVAFRCGEAVTVSSVGLCCVELRRGSLGTAVRGTFRSGLAVMFCQGAASCVLDS